MSASAPESGRSPVSGTRFRSPPCLLRYRELVRHLLPFDGAPGSYLRRAGLRVPEDISVVGYSDLALSQLFDPALTTVVVPFETMGKMAVHRLLEFIRGDASLIPPLVECVPVQLAARESSPPVRVHQVKN